MEEVADIGKLLFSFTVEKDMEWREFRYMGRAVRYMNTKKIMAVILAGILVTILLTLMVSALFLLVFFAVGLQFLVFMEYSARDIGHKIRDKAPLHYDFYEDALVEEDSSGSHTIMYSKFASIKADGHTFTMVGKGTDVVVVPRCLIDKDAEKLLFTLGKRLGGKRIVRRK